jgi:hypothetical protein
LFGSFVRFYISIFLSLSYCIFSRRHLVNLGNRTLAECHATILVDRYIGRYGLFVLNMQILVGNYCISDFTLSQFADSGRASKATRNRLTKDWFECDLADFDDDDDNDDTSASLD